ncbi:uncharacterized protein METZ01_LOCUS234270, partial [marine metagenome]
MQAWVRSTEIDHHRDLSFFAGRHGST